MDGMAGIDGRADQIKSSKPCAIFSAVKNHLPHARHQPCLPFSMGIGKDSDMRRCMLPHACRLSCCSSQLCQSGCGRRQIAIAAAT